MRSPASDQARSRRSIRTGTVSSWPASMARRRSSTSTRGPRSPTSSAMRGPCSTPASAPTASSWSPAGVDRTARVWSASGAPVAVLRGHTDSVAAAAINPTGTQAATASWDGTARTWDLDSALELAVPADEARVGITSASFSADDSTVLASAKDGTVRLWHADTGEEVLAGDRCAVVEESWPCLSGAVRPRAGERCERDGLQPGRLDGRDGGKQQHGPPLPDRHRRAPRDLARTRRDQVRAVDVQPGRANGSSRHRMTSRRASGTPRPVESCGRSPTPAARWPTPPSRPTASRSPRPATRRSPSGMPRPASSAGARSCLPGR